MAMMSGGKPAMAESWGGSGARGGGFSRQQSCCSGLVTVNAAVPAPSAGQGAGNLASPVWVGGRRRKRTLWGHGHLAGSLLHLGGVGREGTPLSRGRRAAGCRCGYAEGGRTEYIPGRIPAIPARPMVAGMDVARWQGVGRAVLADALPAVAAGAVMVLGSGPAAMDEVPPRRPLDALAYVLMGVAAVVLVGRRRWPLVALATTAGASIAFLALQYPHGPILLAMSVAMYAVAVR